MAGGGINLSLAAGPPPPRTDANASPRTGMSRLGMAARARALLRGRDFVTEIAPKRRLDDLILPSVVRRAVDELVEAVSALQRSDLETWIRDELVVPQEEAETLIFTDMECARVRLICTLHYELEIDVDTLPVVLSLVDQLYDTRQRLLSLSAAVAAQNEDVQSAIITAMAPKGGASDVEKS